MHSWGRMLIAPALAQSNLKPFPTFTLPPQQQNWSTFVLSGLIPIAFKPKNSLPFPLRGSLQESAKAMDERGPQGRPHSFYCPRSTRIGFI